MKKKITIRSAIESMRKAVELKSRKYLYPNVRALQPCRYFNANGEPSCIIGYVFRDHGYTLQDFQCRSHMGQPGKIKIDNETGIGFLSFHLDPKVENVLLKAQILQDRGESWGDALDVAMDEARRLGEWIQ